MFLLPSSQPAQHLTTRLLASRLLSAALFLGVWPGVLPDLTGTALAQASLPVGALNVQQVMGRAEMQDGKVWRPLNGANDPTTPPSDAAALSTAPLTNGLRTGTGRAVLGNSAGGKVTVGSASQLRVYSGETDFQQGQFLMEGQVAAFALGNHLVLQEHSRARIDIDGTTQRVAVISGNLRISNGPKTQLLQAGQQLSLQNWQVNSFRENDPWYAAQFSGVGAATLEAFRGAVQVRLPGTATQAARLGTSLIEDSALNTGAGAWAEVGFTGGGYLRLSEQSELRVLAIEKTQKGREVTLQLTKGSAWNVVQKGQGGYRITTPVVSTAVRGTKFRVDASGLVKVVEGQVAIPSEGDAQVSAGQQKQATQTPATLQQDDLDRFNEALDAQRAMPMTLRVSGARVSQQLALSVSALPDTLLNVTATDTTGKVWPLEPSGSTEQGQFQLSAPNLPEGQYQVNIQALRFGHRLSWQGTVRLDRTAPHFTQAKVTQQGRVLFLTGQATDEGNTSPLALEVSVPGRTGQPGQPPAQQIVQRQVSGLFRIVLPLTTPLDAPLTLHLSDAAGNSSDVQLP